MHSSSLAEPVRDTTTEHLTLGERLRQLRKATGCTTGEIAAAAGLHPTHMDLFESDRAKPSTRAAQALARVYGVSVDDLTPASTTTPAGPRLGEGRCER